MRGAGIEEKQKEDETGDSRHGKQVSRRRLVNIGTAEPRLDRHAKAEFLLQFDPAVRDEVIAGIPAAIRSRCPDALRFLPGAFRSKNRPPGNFMLVVL